MRSHETASLLTDEDLYLFNEGSHFQLYDKLGAHVVNHEGVSGTQFSVWAPNAAQIFVMGNFNGWNKNSDPLQPRAQSGIWEGFFPEIGNGTLYKYHIVSRLNDYRVDKADPFSIFNEIPPKTASIVWDLDYQWGDHEWMTTRRQRNALDKPMAIYEMHVGSWRRVAEESNRSLTYRELAPQLADYLRTAGIHARGVSARHGSSVLRLLGLSDHWLLRASGNYGTPQDFMYLIDTLHQRGIGVILDWVPSHFPTDEHGLAFFDGTHLYEHADPRQGFHPDWDSFIFNYGRKEVRSFLISNALFWLRQVSCGRTARRCGCLDAVSGLLPQRRRVDSQPIWRPGEYRGDWISAATERRSV